MQLGQINQCLLAVAIKIVASDGLQWSHRDLLAALISMSLDGKKVMSPEALPSSILT